MLAVADSSLLALNTTNPLLTISLSPGPSGGTMISSVSTDSTASLPITILGGAVALSGSTILLTGTSTTINGQSTSITNNGGSSPVLTVTNSLAFPSTPLSLVTQTTANSLSYLPLISATATALAVTNIALTFEVGTTVRGTQDATGFMGLTVAAAAVNNTLVLGIYNNGTAATDNLFTLATTGDATATTGNLAINTANKGLQIKKVAIVGTTPPYTANAMVVTNITLGTGGTAQVNNSSLTTNHVVFITRTATGGTPGTNYTTTVSAGSFTIASNALSDRSVFNALIVLGIP